jgi:hypothetical protein
MCTKLRNESENRCYCFVEEDNSSGISIVPEICAKAYFCQSGRDKSRKEKKQGKRLYELLMIYY